MLAPRATATRFGVRLTALAFSQAGGRVDGRAAELRGWELWGVQGNGLLNCRAQPEL